MNPSHALHLIREADLTPVIERLVRVDKWKRKHALLAVEQYRNYLVLRKKYPTKELPPSKEIDTAWHAHILHTKDYAQFCSQVFGYYLHHHPHLANAHYSAEQLTQSFNETQELYKQEFGFYLYSVKIQALLNTIRQCAGLFTHWKKGEYHEKSY